jgi:hypothetical protein
MPAATPIVIQKKRGKGCWGCGCAVLIALAVLIVVLLIFSYRSVHAFAHAYTTAAPAPIPTTDAGDAVYQDAQGKLATFTQAFQREQPATLRLNSDEINTFISRNPDYAAMHGKIHVTLQDDTAQIDSSLLLGAVEKVLMPDRYLNTVATLGIGFDPEKQALALDIHQLQLNGQSMPPSANEALNQEINTLVNQQLQANQLAKDFLARVQKIDIENGELVIETR